MKNTLLLATALTLSTGAMAQMPDYSICPDFTGVDLDGNTWNLYDLLDAGKTVVLDVSAAWCSPCWTYHTSGNLENFYNTYGPPGTDDVMVLFIEGEDGNTEAQLYGTDGAGAVMASQGNWVAGTSYPIIDDASIADLLDIGYFPTIYRVCPNRMITEIGQMSTANLWAQAQACNMYEAVTTNDGTVLPNIGQPSVCSGAPLDLEVRLQNTGTTPLTSATIEAKRGTTLLGTTSWTGSLDTYELETVNVTSYTPTGTGTQTITYRITSTDDVAPNNQANGLISVGNTVMPGVDVQLELITDDYASETTWKLFDGNDVVVQQDPAGAYANNTTYTYNWVLNDLECYKFAIYDAFGDGICCAYGNGSYKLKVNGNVIIQGADFDDYEIKPYRTDVLSSVMENSLENGLSVAPNPTSGLLNVTFDLKTSGTAQLDVFNMLGEKVLTSTRAMATGTQRESFDLSGLGGGIYFVTIQADGMRATRKVTLSK